MVKCGLISKQRASEVSEVATNSIDRKVPTWAARLVSRLSRDRPAVVTRTDLASYMAEIGADRNVDRLASDLQQLGWLSTLHLKGVWGFVPPGESRPNDPYLDLRAWRARDPDAVFALAGEAAAWHLGYLPRRFGGAVSIWLPPGDRVPHGLRPHVSIVRIGWSPGQLHRLGPTTTLLHRKGLDLTGWADGLPALGPEALLVQLAVRPKSFRAWGDLVGQLDMLAEDCDPARITDLMEDVSASARQRAGYLLDRGGRHEAGVSLLTLAARTSMPVVQLGDGPEAAWSNDFKVNDCLIAPLQDRLGKA